ncbi:hypothetical protein AL036_20890 [Salipiger aestuarii]|uniref:SIR2 family NAD-dependent protein deacylase n=1 Tax=Salipiger aestuarii TaxID=568098 RepID=UPI00123BD345|nr:SIR2 family protein [Salipiger aestuarii]KAA8605074.1 hypothetical protein AL036_20890 [Salipiger aestuarii]
MADGHDVIRELGYLQQALSQNRKPLGFMISAGCPLSIRVNFKEEIGKDGETWTSSDPLIQDIAGLTRKISETVIEKNDQDSVVWDKVIASFKEDGIEHPNIEGILSFVRGLRGVAGKGEVRGLTGPGLESLELRICDIISEEVDRELPDANSPYHNLAIWVRSIPRESPVHLFTTNYDLLAEQALEEEGAPYFDGFIGSRKAFFDLAAVEDEKLMPSRWTRLWKMHGSINWRLEDHGSVTRGLQSEKNKNYLIYPSHLKYDESRKMPFLAMMDRFKDFILQQSSILFMSGYSFGDEHINNLLLEALRSNPTAMVYGLLHGNMMDKDGKPEEKYQKARKLALKAPNLALFSSDVGIIGRREKPWVAHDEDLGSLPVGMVLKPEAATSEYRECKIGDFLMFTDMLKNISGPRDSDVE